MNATPKRTYVLDTNVLLHDPEALGHFQEHDLVLPITVIEEVDKFKRDLTELGRNARPGSGKSHAPAWQTLLDQGILDVEPLTYIRGRSIPRQYIVVDEAQNLTAHEVKTVITRAGARGARDARARGGVALAGC